MQLIWLSAFVFAAASLLPLSIFCREEKVDEVRDYCEGEIFDATCSEGFAVLVTWAMYGRMRRGRCVQLDTGCASDVRRDLDRRCSGRPSCRVKVTDLLHDGTRPCPMDFRSYLEAGYVCVPVLEAMNGECTVRRSLPVSDETKSTLGYISSYSTSQSGCGSVDSPWLMRAASGQRVNLTLLDFSASQRAAGEDRVAAGAPVCLVYAVIREAGAGSLGQHRTVCGGRGAREEHIMLSSSDSVEIRLIEKRRSGTEPADNFMIAYQFVGCADPALPEGAWLKRDNREALVGCTGSDEGPLWRLTCVDNELTGTSSWNGLDDVGPSCPGAAGLASVPVGGGHGYDRPSIFRGMSVVILASVAGVVGILILTVGLLVLARSRRRALQANFLQERRFDSPGVAAVKQTPGKECRALVEAPPGVYSRTFLPETSSRSLVTCRAPVDCSSRPAHYVEHVYESPTFARRDVNNCTRLPATGGDERLDNEHSFSEIE